MLTDLRPLHLFALRGRERFDRDRPNRRSAGADGSSARAVVGPIPATRAVVPCRVSVAGLGLAGAGSPDASIRRGERRS
jgi:hypothetical protein